MKCLHNARFDVFMFSECIYPSFTTGNAVVSLHRLMGAAKLRAGVRIRALKSSSSLILRKNTVCRFSMLF